jgi:hypothetical protein
MHSKIIGLALCALSLSSAADDIFKQGPMMGGGSATQSQQTQTQVNTGQDTCAALAKERRAIEYIDQKQIWVPIEQQNANYYRMRFLKSEMAARGCRY